ncbi:MAG TPA: NAD-dependent epimerase/dehydratase family protein, partial [Candidatus Binatia bacterium]|nr:NAD-dependent epimerase/dehydratase family protein [Candidatus Binatia bacterium]
MNNSKVLVTGGAGFIGSHLTSELVKRNCRVTVLDDLSGGFVSNVGSKARLVQGSITDERLIRHLFSSEKF